MKINYSQKTIKSVNGLCIESFFTKIYPYANLKMKGIVLTENQKNLIYRLYLEYYYRRSLLKINKINKEIKLIILEKYNDLYKEAMHNNYPLILSYLFHNLLITSPILKGRIYFNCLYCDEKDFINYYSSLINREVIEERPNIFDVHSFAAYIKYSEEFIDNNFTRFLYDSPSKDLGTVFPEIECQQPSFETLIKHAGEFNVKFAIPKLHLNTKQIEDLILMNKITQSGNC